MAIAQPAGFAEPLVPTAAAFRLGVSTPPLQARVDVRVRDRNQQWQNLRFVVDSGSGVTSIPWALATCMGIPIGATLVNTPLITMQGRATIPCYRGTIEVEFPQLPGRQFTFDCQFPDVPGSVPSVLGIGGNVLRQLLIRFDGFPQLPDAPYGFVQIDAIPWAGTPGVAPVPGAALPGSGPASAPPAVPPPSSPVPPLPRRGRKSGTKKSAD